MKYTLASGEQELSYIFAPRAKDAAAGGNPAGNESINVLFTLFSCLCVFYRLNDAISRIDHSVLV
jgi:hypothetical protein